jgi:hypothetical protein
MLLQRAFMSSVDECHIVVNCLQYRKIFAEIAAFCLPSLPRAGENAKGFFTAVRFLRVKVRGNSCLFCRPKSQPPWSACMLAKLNAYALVGIEAVPVEAEVDASAGLPKTVLL